MYHSRWKGSHYAAGLNYGRILHKNGINPMEGISVSSERMEFSKACEPIYQKYYPEILDEIRGMADGLGIDADVMAGFLWTMYGFVFDNKCSCLAVNANGCTYFARNSDFLVSVEKLCDSALYRLDHAHAFVGNTTAWTEMEDGVNEYGLACGLTFIYPVKVRPGFNAGMLVRYILEKCRTTAEAIEALKRLPIGTPQTITLADRKGDIAVVECNCDRLVVRRPQAGAQFVCATNHFISSDMQQFQYDGVDDVHSHERYEVMGKALAGGSVDLNYIQQLLAGKFGFMCQYVRKQGLDTVWSTIYRLAENASDGAAVDGCRTNGCLEGGWAANCPAGNGCPNGGCAADGPAGNDCSTDGCADLILRAEGNPSRNQWKVDQRLKFVKNIR